MSISSDFLFLLSYPLSVSQYFAIIVSLHLLLCSWS